jgi:hypothetical protein
MAGLGAAPLAGEHCWLGPVRLDATNAFVSWLVCDLPWELEDQLIASAELPLNLETNSRHLFRLWRGFCDRCYPGGG